MGGGPINAEDIADSTEIGRALLTAADAAEARATLALEVVSAAAIAALDLSSLPTSDPGGGKVWLNGGVLQVGA